MHRSRDRLAVLLTVSHVPNGIGATVRVSLLLFVMFGGFDGRENLLSVMLSHATLRRILAEFYWWSKFIDSLMDFRKNCSELGYRFRGAMSLSARQILAPGTLHHC